MTKLLNVLGDHIGLVISDVQFTECLQNERRIIFSNVTKNSVMI